MSSSTGHASATSGGFSARATASSGSAYGASAGSVSGSVPGSVSGSVPGSARAHRSPGSGKGRPRVPTGGGNGTGGGALSSSAPVGSGMSARGGRRSEDLVRIVGEHYQLGSEIGRGGFGVVYAALDLRNGRSVAIKQVSLRDIDKDELLSIESEISLLRKLKHENIVKYHDTIKTQSCLYIVLEYMENGSLAQFVKRFGSLSETLVAMYITQVLRGLAYLHEQGVLHRDVKGANILTTKDGLVKLADFGVAIKLSETQKADEVVGSPYWMAPEVIEMAGWSTSSDIWSVGCTIIELLSTKPPYFDLAPMAALFRIVQDDHPPLPDRISPALHDFIMKCFMKEPRLRSSALELLQHPWIAQIPKNKVEQSTQLVSENVTSSNDRDAVLNTIKLYEKSSSTLEGNAPTSASKSEPRPAPVEEDDESENWDDEFGVDSTPTTLSLASTTEKAKATNSANTPLSSSLPPPTAVNVFKLSQEDASALLDDDVWDDQDGLVPLESSASSQRKESATTSTTLSDQARDERASRSWDRSSLVPKTKRIVKLQQFVEDDDEEIAFDDFDENELVKAAAKKQMEMKRDHPSDALSHAALNKFRENEDDGEEDDGFDAGVVIPSDQGLVLRSNTEAPSSSNTFRESMSSMDSSQQENIFGDELDFDYSTMRDINLKVTARVVELLSLLDPSMDDQVILEACDNLEEIFRENATLRRDLMSQPGVVPNIMEALEMKKADVLHAVLRVINMIVEDNQKFQENLALVGLIPVIIKLTKQHNPFFVSDDFGWDQHQGADYGPSSGHDSSMAVRLEAAKFVRQSCKTSPLTLQMFVACGGLPVLVDFFTLDRDAEGNPSSEIDLVRIALDGTMSVFNLQTIPKNDICRLFVKAGLLRKFVAVFNEVVASVGATEIERRANGGHSRVPSSSSVHSIAEASIVSDKSALQLDGGWTVDELNSFCDILLLFSQGDGVVKEHMCDGAVLEGMLKALRPESTTLFLTDNASPREERPVRLLSHSSAYVAAMVKVLKCFRNLSMDPLTLEKLDRAGTIPTLVRLLNEQEADLGSSGSLSGTFLASSDVKQREVENIVLQSMFYLCRINRNRQTHAAQAGIVPSLIKVIRDNSPLKQFALPILCDLAHASPTARAHLWACDVASLFLDLLEDRYWQMDAVKSISVWLTHDTVKMESVLLMPGNLMKLVSSFQNAQDSELENLLEPLLEILSRSVPINQSLGRTGLFVSELLRRLRLVPKAIVRKNLLKILKSLFESHTSPIQFLVEYNLHPIVHSLAQDENSMILVKEIASQLLQSILVAASVF